ncbi:MAG TPA: hypothetical protein VGJ48_14155 [Pyrinomonadaceae bacterium]|jgi:hypothetical protein
MKRLSLGPANQTIALLIFVAASVPPLYSQQVKPSQNVKNSEKAQAAQSTSEQPNEDFKQRNPESSGTDKNSRQVDSSQTSAKKTSQSYTFPTKRERFNRYVKSTAGPVSLARTGISAGIDQWRDNPEEWEQGASGYGKRFASGFGRNAIQQTVIYGLDTAMGLDTGFKRSERKGFFPRMTDALAENVTSRTRTGKRVISVPRLSGVYVSRIISAETWYPSRYDYKDGLRSGTRSLVTGFGINLVREFIIRW